MARKVQHIADRKVIEDAKRSGAKARALCGKKIYPMTEMDESIPTCTPCANDVLAELNRLPERGTPWAWVWSGGLAG